MENVPQWPNDAGRGTGCSPAKSVLLEHAGGDSATSEVVRRGAPHDAAANNNDVGMFGHELSKKEKMASGGVELGVNLDDVAIGEVVPTPDPLAFKFP